MHHLLGKNTQSVKLLNQKEQVQLYSERSESYVVYPGSLIHSKVSFIVDSHFCLQRIQTYTENYAYCLIEK